MSELATQRQQVFDYVYAMLGGGIVDVELDPIHYNTALDKALARYRQRGENSTEESYVTMTLEEDQNEYILSKEIVEVRQIFRRSVGAKGNNGDGSSIFEPFHQAYLNTYLLSGSSLGGLLTYELLAQRQELVGRMFGSFIEFRWNTASKKLTVLQKPKATEEVLLWCYNYRPDSQLLVDYLSSQWIRDYTLSTCKYMLGEAREKFATFAGPQGGTSLNGGSLKAEAQSEMEKLDIELATSVAGGSGYGFIIG